MFPKEKFDGPADVVIELAVANSGATVIFPGGPEVHGQRGYGQGNPVDIP